MSKNKGVELFVVYEVISGDFKTRVDAIFDSEKKAFEYLEKGCKLKKISKEPFILNKEGEDMPYYALHNFPVEDKG